MKRLRGSDAFTLYCETPSSPFVTLKVATYEPTDPTNPPSTEDLKQFIISSINALGRARAGLRILRVPLDLHHPVWVTDPEFAPENHIYRVALPAPGGKAELCDFLSDFISIPLNPNRPLWELWLLEGFEGGGIAVAFKIHHALADGKQVASLIRKAHLKEAPPETREIHLNADSIPGKTRLFIDALVDLFKSYTIELPDYYHCLKQARGGSAAIEVVEGETVKPFSAPWTILNQAGGFYRLYRYETFSLPEFKTLSKHFDCTINTMILGVCSEALKRYLEENGNLPSASLVSGIPVGDQSDASPKTMLRSDIQNNKWAGCFVPLYQNIEDFAARLQAIKLASTVAVNAVRHSNGRRLDNFFDFLPGTFARWMNYWSNKYATEKRKPLGNVAISNVPGPRRTLYALGGRLEMVNLMSTGNLVEHATSILRFGATSTSSTFPFYFERGHCPTPRALSDTRAKWSWSCAKRICWEATLEPEPQPVAQATPPRLDQPSSIAL